MIRKKEEILESVKALLGENTSDEVITFLEDLDDTLSGDGTDWHAEYDRLDRDWRERYRNRFFNGPAVEEKEVLEEKEEAEKPLTYDELFKKGE